MPSTLVGVGWQELETTLPAVSTVRKQRGVRAGAQLVFYVLSSLGAEPTGCCHLYLS